MTSYMYNPSQKVTDILSKFFDFDPSELQLGIWSGDLQLKNVKLRQETIHPLLNRKANKPHVDPLKKAPLHMKLVSGTVGTMRMRIPWKRLVWGQGDVQVEISDVSIVITLQSREETEEQRRNGLLKERKKKDKSKEGNTASSAYREAKQRRLREAERRHVQGMPLALFLETLHHRNSIARDAAKIEAAEAFEGKPMESSVHKKPGKLDKWLQKTGSDLFWRFFSGIQGSITKARIIIVQDGVEIGCIIQSIEIIAGKDGTNVQVNMDDHTSDLSDESRAPSDLTPPEGVMYESVYEDGEHVDKVIKQQGLGVFVRKEVNMSKVPQSLRFSTSVAADDYILSPVDMNLAFSFFYPFPPERRKKPAADNRSQSTPTTAESTTAAVSVGQSQSASSANRRGKRDKDRVAANAVAGTPSFKTIQKTRGNITPLSAPGSRLRNQHRRLFPEPGSTAGSQRRSVRSSHSMGNTVQTGLPDHLSLAPESNSTHQYPRNLDVVPTLECRVTMKDIRIVFSTRHYEMLNYFFSTISRMKNGRPDHLIRSTPKETNTEVFKRKFMTALPEVTPSQDGANDEIQKNRSVLLRVQNANALRAMLAPITGLVAGSDDLKRDQASVSSGQEHRRSIRAQTVRKWWRYSIGAIVWEIKKRKHLATNFREMYISFDWKRQSYKRKMYIDLYLAKELSERKDGLWPFEDGEKDKRKADLLLIEDELALEQILLYRSIARSIRVRGITEMPKSILQLHSTQTLKSRDKKKRRSFADSKAASKSAEVREDTLLSCVQRNFKSSMDLREPGGLRKKFQSSNVPSAKCSSLFDDSESELETEASQSEYPRSGDVARPAVARHASFDTSGFESTLEQRTPRNRRRRASLGNINSSIHDGNVYATASAERDSDIHTLRTFQKKDAKDVRAGKAATGTGNDNTAQPDDRMRISCSWSIRTVDIMVVEEEYVFDLSPDRLKQLDVRRKGSVASSIQEYYSGDDESSCDNFSDISIMTDDERFFSQDGQVQPLAEEETEETAAKMSSSDFLNFGLPENPLLRLTVDSLGCTARGRSGGRFDFGVSVRTIDAVSEKAHIFSMGMHQETTMNSDAKIGMARDARRTNFDSFDLDLAVFNGLEFPVANTKSRRSAPAITMLLSTEDSHKSIQCDLSDILLTMDLSSLSKLLNFYTKSEIKFPDKVIEKSSWDVARKFLVYKTASNQGFAGNISAALRVQGIGIRVPFSAGDKSENQSPDETSPKFLENNSALVFSITDLDLHSGDYVEDIVAGAQINDLSVSGDSRFCESTTSTRACKSLEMIDIIALTTTNDSFSCKHVVTTITGVNCLFETSSGRRVNLIDSPIAVETLLTVNGASLLDTELPKNQLVVELSPVEVLLSTKRLEMMSCVNFSLDFSVLDTSSSSAILKKIHKPDPPRIEILSRKILHMVDLNCKSVQLKYIRDLEIESETISPKLKEAVLEECLGDFLSVMSCFELSFPNEEALSSAMQVCISRLVGLGFSNEDAWECTNAARLNFLDDIAFMRRTQSEALEQLSTNMGKESSSLMPSLQKLADMRDHHNNSTEYGDDGEDSVEISLSETSTGDVVGPSIEVSDPDDPSEDDDSAQSVEIVDTTLQNAVEKTVAAFAPRLHACRQGYKDLYLDAIVTVELPLGFRVSTINLFYDSHLAVLVTSLVVMNTAGIELLTLVPAGVDEGMTLQSDLQVDPGHGLSFSRYYLDRDYLFGEGGLPMSALAADDDEGAILTRSRSLFDDVTFGEMEILFSSKIAELIIDEISQFHATQKKSRDAVSKDSIQRQHRRSDNNNTECSSSLVLSAISMSALFTTDDLVPFSRMTLESIGYRNSKALEKSSSVDLPSWFVVAEKASLHNLTPVGQFYPDTLSLIVPPFPPTGDDDFPFQIHFFSSPDPWKTSSRLLIDFQGFRLFLLRQFIHELLQFFVYDRDGIGRLKKKYSKDVRDTLGNQRPPLLWSVRIRDTSIICPRSSTDSDMVAFEVEKAFISVSYIPMSFEMPSEGSPFCPAPEGRSPTSKQFSDMAAQNNFFSTASEFHECMEDFEDKSDESSSEPISAFSKDLKKRIAIYLKGVRVFTVTAPDSRTRDAVESPMFRFFYAINGRAADGKTVYHQEKTHEHHAQVEHEALKELDRFKQHWEEISTEGLDVEIFADYAPHMRLFIGSRESPFTLDARMSQLCLILSVWDNNMQEQPTMFPFPRRQVSESAIPPKIPNDFPEYGTRDFVAHIHDTSSIRSEICCIFKELSLRCTYDPPGHFSVDPGCFKYMEDPACHQDERPGVVLALEDAHIHVLNDFLNVRRIGIGALFLEIIDQRQHETFQKILSTTRVGLTKSPPRAWADVSWGLRTDVTTLGSSLPMPVIFTVFMTPGWSLINLGAQSLNGIMHDLSWIWVFLDYFKSYYTDVAFGNRGHQAQRWVHKVKNAIRRAKGENPRKFEPLPGVNVDFRLWLCQPILTVPSEYHSPHAPSLRIDSRTGLWYRYKSIQELSSQEVSTTDLNLHFSIDFQSPHSFREANPRDNAGGQRALVEGLSFGLRYDCNNSCNHKDVSLLIPFEGEDTPDLSVAGQELEVKPLILPTSIVCRPEKPLTRLLGTHVCEITCFIEILPITSKTMINFFKGPTDLNEDFLEATADDVPVTFSITANLRDLRVFAIDPVLGVQLPVAVVSIASFDLCTTKFEAASSDEDLFPGDSPPDDMQLVLKSHLWVDYFKLGMTRSWEPLIEPIEFLLMQETSKERGRGMSLEVDGPLHMNLTGSFLQILGDTMESFSSVIKDTFGEKVKDQSSGTASVECCTYDRGGTLLEDSILTTDGVNLQVLHEIPKPLKRQDRVAFSMRNLTGEKLRVHQQIDRSTEMSLARPAVVTYLNHAETMGLTFSATISIIKNLDVVEVPYPGLPDSPTSEEKLASLTHAIDLQIPGFRWIHDIKVDTFGRRFESLTPRSLDVLDKLSRDWRLRNALMLLTEVGFDSGGRLVTVRSLFEITNSTAHPIKLFFDPDPRMQPSENLAKEKSSKKEDQPEYQQIISISEGIEIIQPGETFHIPTLLLQRSLQMTGSHLGCLWLCPEATDKGMLFTNLFRTATTISDDDDLDVSFSSRPIQLAKLVYESSIMFQNAIGKDIATDDTKSGVQVSCPTTSRKGVGCAPFCYAIEVTRSPIINSNREGSELDGEEPTPSESRKSQKKKSSSKKVKEHIHGPILYSLSIHAPLVIVNLLPEGGRFELMHAVRKTVVWYADLKPGQQVPIHSVGLDAPLLLLVNLGFCRTPVGEGALVHHGADSGVTVKKGEQGPSLKSIGMAALNGTKQIGKTLTAISDSPDRRGQGRLAKINARQLYSRDNRKNKSTQVDPSIAVYNESLGLENESPSVATSGKVHSVDSAAFSLDEVATETTVVDGIGQRLTLYLENIRGGGGERRVSLYCPFWIVNTTEHALRYKQDKAKSFVSGTFHDREKDGSRPVDGSNRNHRQRHKKESIKRETLRHDVTSIEPDDSSSIAVTGKGVFAGRPGLLATSPGHTDLPAHEISELIDRNLSLERLAQLAFMFNFHDEGLSIGNHLLSVQLYDGSGDWNYTSEWSRGFSLDSVGFSLIVAMNTKEGRAVELAAEVNVAPGILSDYTKIVRFVPRYVVFNRLEKPIRIWQDSSVLRPVAEEPTVTGLRESELNHENRKWRYYYEEKHKEGKINQYEALYGRPSTIDYYGNNTCSSIPEGTTAHGSALFIKTLAPNSLMPFLLPDTRSERQLRLDLGKHWSMSPSFSTDLPGEHILNISRAKDLRTLKHVSTRAAPKYNIILPPPENSRIGEWDGELGVFFETEWGTDRRIIVKGTKRGHFAFNHTDIRPGDELLRIDGVSVTKLSFGEAMRTIKERITLIRYETEQRQNLGPEGARRQNMLRRIGQKRRLSTTTIHNRSGAPDGHRMQLVLTFSTLEERLRKSRAKTNRSELSPQNRFGDRDLNSFDEEQIEELSTEVQTVKVETKSIHNTMFIILRKPDEENPPFRIQNRSINYSVFFRQRGCQRHPWNVLFPGESVSYAWEEPMRSKKLTVRLTSNRHIAHNGIEQNGIDGDLRKAENEGEPDFDHDSENDVVSPEQEKSSSRIARLRQALAYQYVDNEERGGYGTATSVRLEEIGFRAFLPVPYNESGRNSHRGRNFLNCEVDTDGRTRLLIVSDDEGSHDDSSVLEIHLETLKKQISYEQQRNVGLQSLQYLLVKETSVDPNKNQEVDPERVDVIENDAKRFVEDFPEESTILSRHQIVVEVIEAAGLHASDFVGTCNPYCEIYLKGRSRSRRHFFQKRRNKRKTYFIENSLSPQWIDQKFVFNVPEEAVRVTRGHHLQIKLRNFRLVGQHPILGQTTVHFGSIRDQQELVGWYPLAGRTGRGDIENAHVSDVARGSIKMRVQWIYTTVALIDYFMMLTQVRLLQLTKSHHGMSEQLSHAIDSDERRREARESVNAAGRITKLAKLQKRTRKKEQFSVNRVDRNIHKKNESAVGKMSRINLSLIMLKETLKTSRDRYLQVLYFQTTESKKKRQLDDYVADKPNDSFEDPSCDRRSPVQNNSREESPGSSYDHLPNADVSSLRMSPNKEKNRNRQSLDEFFAMSKSTYTRSPFLPGSARLRSESGDSPRRRNRHLSLDADILQRLSHRKLSLDVDCLGEDRPVDNELWNSSLRGSLTGNQSGVSDNMSMGTGVNDTDTSKRRKRILKDLGFIFHEQGVYFHRNHLPHHFRRSLFGVRLSGNYKPRLYCPNFAVMSNPNEIVMLKSAQAAGALFIDPELEVIPSKYSFFVHLRSPCKVVPEKHAFTSSSKEVISESLKVPDVAPITTKRRSAARVEALKLSRRRFERAARRNVGAALNPGGRLTVRPITALNLPDGYSGMLVKLRYGSEILLSETVDARVSPRWAPSVEKGGTKNNEQSVARKYIDSADFGLTRNDLNLQVEPHQTSGVIKVTVAADNSKTELGSLEIPLGAVIAACLDSQFDDEDTHDDGRPLRYVRWFPLMNPKLASPAEGDMGLCTRPVESEQLRDSMFQHYFTPCIQLAFMWLPEAATGLLDAKETEMGVQQPTGIERSIPYSRTVSVSPAIERYFNADIGRISLALIDSVRATELLSLAAIDLDVRYSVTKTKTRTGLTVEWIQIDHQDPRARQPVVLAPAPADALQPTLQILALKDNVRTKRNITSYEYIGVSLREMDLTVEESWIFELWDFFMGIKRRRTAKRRTEQGQPTDVQLTSDNCFSQSEGGDAEVPPLLSILQAEADGAPRAKLYIEQLILGFVKVNLSYIKGKKQIIELSEMGVKALETGESYAASGIVPDIQHRGDQSEIFLKWSHRTHDEEYSNNGGHNLPGIIAAVFPSVSDASIRLQGKVIEHVFESSGEIVSSIKTFYTNETLRQLYKIIGSLDFVGNPTILFSSFVSGVRDFVAAPTSAFLKSPTNVNQVGIAVGMGTLSFFSHSTSGIFGFAAKMSAAAGQAAAVLSLDKEFSQWHRESVVNDVTNLNRAWKQRGIQNLPEMLARPLGDIITGLAMGTSGLIMSPYKGFKEGGGTGFLRGVAIGTAGVVAKPLVGVLDAFTHFSAAAHDVAKSVNVLERRYQPALKLRFPYTFGPMNILCPFDPVAARSVYLLRSFPVKRKYIKHQKHTKEILVHAEVLHMEAGVDTYAIATTIRIVLIREKKDTNGNLLPTICWEVLHGDTTQVASRISDHGHNGVALTITRRVTADKAEEIKGSKFKKPKLVSEALNTPTFSSALSMESAFSDVESYEAAAIEDTLDLGEAEQVEHFGNDESKEVEPDPTFEQGATKKGDDVVKWFTVLAEYQHRPQLTRLHNVISSLVGEYGALIRDRSVFGHGEKEGITRFGLFNFEKPTIDQRSIAASNSALITSLEALPWIYGQVFERIERLPKSQQRDAVLAARRSWTFATDLESSKREGGPSWLIEERARATFASLEGDYRSQVAFYSLGRPVDEQQNKSLGIFTVVEKVFDSWDDDTNSDHSLSVKILQADDDIRRARWESPQVSSDQIVAEGRIRSSSDNPIEIEGDVFHSIVLEDSTVLRRATVSSDNRIDLACVDEALIDLDANPPVRNALPIAVAPVSAIESLVDSDKESSRIDRMESLMEKLVTINAQQIQEKQPGSSESVVGRHMMSDSRLADMLRIEVAELRSQVQARAVEDDVLRNEINLLRQQLADRRNERSVAREGRIKIPEIFRFGAAKKIEDKKESQAHEAKDDRVYSVYQTQMKEANEEPNRKVPRPTRRLSVDSSAASSASFAEAPLIMRGVRPGGRLSNETISRATPPRRASIGSLRSSGTTPAPKSTIDSDVTPRPSLRRMSG